MSAVTKKGEWMGRVIICALMCVSSTVLLGCPNDDNNAQSNANQGGPVQQLVVDFDQDVALESSVLTMRLRGTERLVAQKVVVSFDGLLDDSETFSWSYDAVEAELTAMRPADEVDVSSGVRRFDGDTGDMVVALSVRDALWSSVAPNPDRRFTGDIRVSVIDLFGKVTAEGVLEMRELEFKRELIPSVERLEGGEVFADERVLVAGSGFLRPEEGETILVVNQGSVTYSDGTEARSLDGQEVPLEWDGSRGRAALIINPSLFGVRVATFQGNVTFINRLRDGSVVEGNMQSGVTFDLQQPFISTLACAGQDPCVGGSRGQRIEVKGRGLIAPRNGVLMTLRFDGLFTPDDPELEPFALTGPTALERAPDRFFDDQSVEISIWYDIERIGQKARLTGLGSEPGTFRGTITPILTGPDGTQLGLPWQGEFKVLSARQIVYLKYLPRFSTGLEKYGLRNVENEIRAKIIEAAKVPYKDFSVDFVDQPPVDFIDYATIELSGPDPFGDGTFGYDNSTNDGIIKDTNNLFLADYIGGYNQGSADEFDNPFGGIYIESFDYFSPKLSAAKNGMAVDDADESFDRVLGPFMPELGGDPVRGTEVGSGARAAQIQEAIDLFGNVIGNTVAHEVGHSMGMAYFRADDISPTSKFHNDGDSPGALMDSGSNRSFEERAGVNDVPPARFNSVNAEYMSRILPGGQ